MIYLTMLVCFICSILITPVVKKLAFKIGATDKPNQRKVHQKIMPRLGGLAIYISFVIGVFITPTTIPSQYLNAIMIGSAIIIITGILDDMIEISAKMKLVWPNCCCSSRCFMGGVQVEFINLPFTERI